MSWARTIERTVARNASTYALRFGDRTVWKIGHAQDLDERLAEVNKHISHEVLDEQWRIAFGHLWPDSLKAFEMEQAILRFLTAARSVGERVLCSLIEIETAWIKANAEVRRRGDLTVRFIYRSSARRHPERPPARR